MKRAAGVANGWTWLLVPLYLLVTPACADELVVGSKRFTES